MTKAEATKIADAALKTMPAGWKTVVFENCGWHVGLDYMDGRVHVFYSEFPYKDGKRWFGLVSPKYPQCGDCNWSSRESFKTPREAADYEVKVMSKYVDDLVAFRKWALKWNAKERKHGSR